MLIVLKKQ